MDGGGGGEGGRRGEGGIGATSARSEGGGYVDINQRHDGYFLTRPVGRRIDPAFIIRRAGTETARRLGADRVDQTRQKRGSH